jgi:segregation and condensation protein B
MSQLIDMEINGQRFGAVVEAILFAAHKPLTADEIASVITGTELAPPIEEEDVANVIHELNAELEEQGRAFTIQVKGGGYTFATQPKYHSWLEHFQHQNAKRKISPSAVETLAIVAYRQPITKPEVDHIRGVDSGYILRQLLEKDLIEVAGRYEGPGRALLYRTTPIFLQHFGINTIDELPKPREIEEILRDDDMAEHRQLMLELKSELRPPLAETGGVSLGGPSPLTGKDPADDKPGRDDKPDAEDTFSKTGNPDVSLGPEPEVESNRDKSPDQTDDDDDAIWLDFGNGDDESMDDSNLGEEGQSEEDFNDEEDESDYDSDDDDRHPQ